MLLARAGHTRGGANWRDAIPFYDKVLALDPDNVPANLARVELYSEAGLRETALASLDLTLARRPRSVALLRATAAALRELDRTTEAEELTARYAQLRFDDTSVVTRPHRARARAPRRGHGGALDRAPRRHEPRQRSRARGRGARLRRARRPPEGDRDASTRARPRARGRRRRCASLADVYALGGQTDEQLRLLKRVLELRPQEKDVREYVAHTEPSRPRADEAYARPSVGVPRSSATQPAHGRNRAHARRPPGHHGLPQRPREPLPPGRLPAAHRRGRRRGARVRLLVRGRHRDGAAPRREDPPQDGPGRRGHRERRGPDRQPVDGDVLERARVLRALPAARPGRRRRAALPRRGRDARATRSPTTSARSSYMQSTEPIARAEYVLITPKSRQFFFNKPTSPASCRRSRRRATRRSGTSSPRTSRRSSPSRCSRPSTESLGHVHVSTYKSWDDMGRWYWGLVRDQFTADDEVRRRVAEITKGLTDDKAKVRAVYEFVVQKTRYVALEFGIHGFKPYRCAQIFARGFGDCKDKATLIVTMLKELGIPATIVIVRTGLRGDFETEPASLAPFDHAIAYVPSMDIYLDGTAEWTGSTELPSMDRGSLALQINEGKPKLVHLPEPTAADSVVEQARRGDGRHRRQRADRLARRRHRRVGRLVAPALPREGDAEAARAGGPLVRAARPRRHAGHLERPRGRRAEGRSSARRAERRATRAATASRGRCRSARRSTWSARGRRSRRAAATSASTRSPRRRTRPP